VFFNFLIFYKHCLYSAHYSMWLLFKRCALFIGGEKLLLIRVCCFKVTWIKKWKPKSKSGLIDLNPEQRRHNKTWWWIRQFQLINQGLCPPTHYIWSREIVFLKLTSVHLWTTREFLQAFWGLNPFLFPFLVSNQVVLGLLI
jgi:hypothetical protein